MIGEKDFKKWQKAKMPIANKRKSKAEESEAKESEAIE